MTNNERALLVMMAHSLIFLMRVAGAEASLTQPLKDMAKKVMKEPK